MPLFRQLFDSQSSSYTYLLADERTGQAVLIDPVFEQVPRDIALIRELGLTLAWTLDTHVHADHVTGASAIKQLTKSRIALSAGSGATGADRGLADRDKIEFGRRYLSVRATPGHTNGCITYVLDDESCAFTGDCLLIRGCGRTDFQQGSARDMYRSVHSQIFSLPEKCLLYPAHDYRGLSVTSVLEERTYNPRLGGQISEDDFVGYMENLGLPHPKQIDVAIPANLRCGRSDDSGYSDSAPNWAPLTLTFAGIWEVQPQWVEDHLRDVQVIDVREPDEYDGPLGHVTGSRLIPLGQLTSAAATISRDRPIVTLCRSGARSAQATIILKRAGFERVANVAGGMLRWRANRLLVEGGSE